MHHGKAGPTFTALLVAQRQILVGPEVRQLIGYELVIFFGMAQTEARIAAASLPMPQLMGTIRNTFVAPAFAANAGRATVSHPFYMMRATTD